MTATQKPSWFARHKVLTVILAIVGLFIIAGAFSPESSTNNSSNTPESNTKKSDSTKTYKVAEPARDGKFEFTVNGVKCGETSIGSEYSNVKAQGQFCRVNVTVKNIGNEAQTLDSYSQYAYNPSSQKYSTNSQAAIYDKSSNSSGGVWYDNINPGNTVTGDLFFDIPKDQSLAKVELHDSSFSGGVTINL